MYQVLLLILMLFTTWMNKSQLSPPIQPIPAIQAKSSICIDKGAFPDVDGPYEHLIFNASLKGDVYQYPRPKMTHYLYPFIENSAEYFYFISDILYNSGNRVHTWCYIGNVGILGFNYLFDVKDCQFWAAYDFTAKSFQIAPDMIVSKCQFDDICVEGATLNAHINTNYKYEYWDYITNGAVYYNDVTRKYVYPYLHTIDANTTLAKYIIDSAAGDTFANTYCIIGINIPWYYVFDINDCQLYRTYYALQWKTEPNMKFSTNCVLNV